MQQNKLRRGLAASAVGALAVTGLALAPAPAQAADGDGARLVSQQNGKASLRVDGDAFLSEETIDLVAERLDANTQISFEVNADPDAGDASAGWNVIHGPVEPGDRFVSFGWNGRLGEQDFTGSSVALRVAATNGGETVYSTRNDVAITGQDSEVHSVSLGTPNRGYFVQPYANSSRTGTLIGVQGSTSASEGQVRLAWWRSSDGSFQGTTAAAVTPADFKVFDGNQSTTIEGGRFSTAFDITGYDAAASDDALAVRGLRGTDGVAAVEGVYEQTVEEIDAIAQSATSKGTTRVQVRVLDQFRSPVVGAEVRRLSDGSLVGYTGVDGTHPVRQANETTESYYVNTTDANAYQEGTDKVSEPVETEAFTPVATDTEAVLADGAVFDDDEYREGDIVLQVVDQEGSPYRRRGEQIWYTLHRDGEEQPELEAATTNRAGQVVVPFDPAGEDGTYRLVYSTPANADVQTEHSTTFVAGDARLRLTPKKGTARSGGKITYTGLLAVGDAPMKGRRVDLSYVRGAEQAPGDEADAGILAKRRLKTSAKVRTKADGTFTVVVADDAERGRPAESGRLKAVAGPAREKASATARFGSTRTGKAEPELTLDGSSDGAAADQLVLSGPAALVEQPVEVLTQSADGSWQVVPTGSVARDGVLLTVEDLNGEEPTSYQVRLVTSDGTQGTTSNAKLLP